MKIPAHKTVQMIKLGTYRQTYNKQTREFETWECPVCKKVNADEAFVFAFFDGMKECKGNWERTDLVEELEEEISGFEPF